MLILSFSIKNIRSKLDGIKKRSYTVEELDKALGDIKSGKLGTRKAAALYKIPRSTLRNKVHKMNNVERKSRPINNSIATKLSIDDSERNSDDLKGLQSTSDQPTSAKDLLRDLLKRNLYSKTNETNLDQNSLATNNLDDSDQMNSTNQNIDLQFLPSGSGTSLIENYNPINNLNNSSLIDSQENRLINNDLMSNFILQTLGCQQINYNYLIDFLNLIKQQQETAINNNSTTNNDKLNQRTSQTNDLDESMNSILSSNSATSSALKLNLNDQLMMNSNLNDDDNETILSSLDDKSRGQNNNLEHSNDDEHNDSDESNASLINEPNNHDQMIRPKTNLNDSINSNHSLNLTDNPLFYTLNLLNNPLNQLNLANLTNNFSNLNNLSNLTNINNLNSLTNFNNLNNLQLNVLPTIDLSKQNPQNLGKNSFKFFLILLNSSKFI